MSKSIFRRISVLLSVALAVGLVAASATLAATARRNAEVTINLLYRSTNSQHDNWVKWLVDTFNQQHQGSIKVVANGIPDVNYHQKVSLVLKGSNPPDVFFSWEGGWAQTMVDDGFAAPLDAYYKKYHWNTELNSAANKLATFGGHQWFVPYYMSASVVWYNTDLFKKYNLKPPKTWTQLQHVADVLKSHGVAPFLLANQQQWEAQFPWTAYFVNKYGEPAYQKLLAHKIKWTDPRVVATFAEMKKWVDDGWFLKGVNSMDFDGTAIIFWKREKAAMWYQGSFIMPKFLNSSNKLTYPVDWFPFPKIGSTKPSISMFAENTWMINKASQHKDQAAELLNFLVSKQAQNKMVQDFGPFPANKSVGVSSLPPMAQRLGKKIAQYKGFTWMHIDHALGPGIATPFLEELQGVLAGTATPQAAAQKVEQAAVRTMGSGG